MSIIEYEVKILDINEEDIKNKLETLWAKFHGRKHFRRYIEEVTDINEKWLRLRTDWEKTTLTFKEILWTWIGWVKEHEVTVSDFDEAYAILENLGYNKMNYFENFRDTYTLWNLEFEIDICPLIPVYMEIEWKSKEDVERWVKMLGYEMKDTTTMWINQVYTKYGIDSASYNKLTFATKII